MGTAGSSREGRSLARGSARPPGRRFHQPVRERCGCGLCGDPDEPSRSSCDSLSPGLRRIFQSRRSFRGSCSRHVSRVRGYSHRPLVRRRIRELRWGCTWRSQCHLQRRTDEGRTAQRWHATTQCHRQGGLLGRPSLLAGTPGRREPLARRRRSRAVGTPFAVYDYRGAREPSPLAPSRFPRCRPLTTNAAKARMQPSQVILTPREHFSSLARRAPTPSIHFRPPVNPCWWQQVIDRSCRRVMTQQG